MAFVARFSRREAGGYDCTYGKGSKQLTAVMEQLDGQWKITAGFGMETVPDKKCGVVKEGWGQLAEAAYGSIDTPETPVLPVPRAALADFPTPDMAPEGAATCPNCLMPFNGWSWQKPPENSREHKRAVPPCRCNAPNPIDYAPSGDDYRMYRRGPSGEFDILTEIGALDLIYHWMLRNKDYCMTDGVLDQPWLFVQETLWRDTGYAEYRPEVWQ